jgi:hypothetical protein
MSHNTLSSTYTPVGQSSLQQRMVFKNNMFIFYDASNNISSVFGWVTSTGTVPILIIAQQGKDVFADVLQISRPAGL